MKTWAWVVVGAGLATGPAWATVDLNSATASQLQKELGLSRNDAMSIIEHRERQPFQSTSELSQVSGFDQAKAETLKGKLTAQPPAPQPKAKAVKTKKPKVAKAKTPKAKKAKSARSSKSKKVKPPTGTNVPAPHAAASTGTTRGFAVSSQAAHPHASTPRAAL
jgi:hypothetical protein